MIFLLIPAFALVFFLVFGKCLKYFGSALILSTHFLTYNLLFYTLLLLIIYLPYQLSGSTAVYNLPYKVIDPLLYNNTMKSFSTAVFGLYNGFEAMHIVFWGIWLFAAFRRLFRLHWLSNLLASYFIARLFFLLVFCLYKKFLIAFTLWNM